MEEKMTKCPECEAMVDKKDMKKHMMDKHEKETEKVEKVNIEVHVDTSKLENELLEVQKKIEEANMLEEYKKQIEEKKEKTK